MLITVAICTWNRCELLRQALEQMTRLVIPSGMDWEILVVNNNCTDATDEVIAAFESRLPIRRLFEQKPGQSNARNAAVREARGKYILWTDDDVLVDEQWVAAYVTAFEQWPEAAFFGGLIRPWFAVPPPAWLERTWPIVAGAYATRDLGCQPVRFDGIGNIFFGANYVVRSAEQRRYCYDPQLGLRPGGNLRGDELEVLNALLADGYQGWWVPEASVSHYIPRERMTVRYIRKFYFGYGEYVAMREPSWHGPMLFGKPRWLWRYAMRVEARYRRHRLTSSPEVWMKYLIDAGTVWGRLLTK